MREIKYRIWDNQEEIYLNEKDVAIDNLGNIFVFENCDENDADSWHARILVDLDNERYIIEQSTGLKDKNGIEIYEGDIIDGRSIGADRGNVEVIFESGAFVLKIDYWIFNPQLGSYNQIIEVVGNIHKNPELLKANR